MVSHSHSVESSLLKWQEMNEGWDWSLAPSIMLLDLLAFIYVLVINPPCRSLQPQYYITSAGKCSNSSQSTLCAHSHYSEGLTELVWCPWGSYRTWIHSIISLWDWRYVMTTFRHLPSPERLQAEMQAKTEALKSVLIEVLLIVFGACILTN